LRFVAETENRKEKTMGSESVSTNSSDPIGDDSRPTILLTGFGPFATYATNPAWSALKILQERCDQDLPNSKFNFVFRMIPVEYETVTETMPRWWNELKPKIIIHVGTGVPDGSLHVEKRAYNKGYCCKDVENCVPCDNCYETSGPLFLDTGFDVESIVQEINTDPAQWDGLRPAKLSNNPGRFLCGFIYYQSLYRYSGNSLFIHVPPIDDTSVTAEKLANGLKLIILAVLKQAGYSDKDQSPIRNEP